MRARVACAAAALTVSIAGCGGASDSTDERLPAPERGLPSDPAFRKDPRGTIMLIHGGGWQGPSRQAIVLQRATARELETKGFETLNVEYGKGRRGIDDIVRVFDAARARRPGRPICAFGQSAGGHLALLLAAVRPSLACVISLAGPTDLPALTREEGGARTYRLAVAAFGTSRLAQYSPVARADRIMARVLQVAATNDPYIPTDQPRQLKRVLPRSELILLPPGDVQFIHSKVDAASLPQVYAAQERLLDEVAPR